jgi:hypothetical protein
MFKTQVPQQQQLTLALKSWQFFLICRFSSSTPKRKKIKNFLRTEQDTKTPDLFQNVNNVPL